MRLSAIILLMIWSTCLQFAIQVASAQSDSSQSESTDSGNRELARTLQALADDHRGEVGLYVKHLASGEVIAINADEPMPTASLIKLAIMVEAYRQADHGELDFSDTLVELTEADKVPGSGILTTHFSSGTSFPILDLIHLMIVYSDNTATNLVLNSIGIASVSDAMEEYGLTETKAHSLVYRRDTSVFPERSAQFGIGSTTARETGWLLEQIANRTLVSEQASTEMLRHLSMCDDDTKIASRLPSGTPIGNKTGAISNVRCDGAIITTSSGPLVVVVLTNQNEDQSWDESNEAHQLCGNVGRAAFRSYHEDSNAIQGLADLRNGATGKLVEDLQRTLNDRLEPSPELSIDGDFGPNTQSAVERFQRANELSVTGVVDNETWSALGELLTSNQPVDEPAIVNARVQAREGMDSLYGAPFVTCKSFAMVDLETGESIAGLESNEQRDIASTTKIFTALVVLRTAERVEGLLSETVTFSRRADQTAGSTSGVREGEQVSLSELLYGLMLPSGNDASVAIAEHVGRHLLRLDEQAVDGSDGSEDEWSSRAYDRFIDEMNSLAKDSGLTNTMLANPHGLTEENHFSTATDLAKISRIALEDERFREIINTRERGARLESAQGYHRNVVWRNTNRLLRIEGYSGVKTGTTSAAGACLVALAERDGNEVLIVVLGSTSSDARYSDTRNLARWAFRQ